MADLPPPPSVSSEDWQTPDEVRHPKKRWRFVPPGSFLDSPFGKVFITIVLIVGIATTTTFIFLAGGQLASFLYLGWIGFAEFMIPSAQGNGWAVILGAVILIDTFGMVKVHANGKTYRCRKSGENNGTTWHWTGIDGRGMVAAAKMNLPGPIIPGQGKTSTSLPTVLPTGLNNYTLLYTSEERIARSRDGKKEVIVFKPMTATPYPLYQSEKLYDHLVQVYSSRRHTLFTLEETQGRPFDEAVTGSRQVVGGGG